MSFLLHYWRLTGEEQALQMVEGTLVAMRNGGIFDQIGFGFARYSTDQQPVKAPDKLVLPGDTSTKQYH